MRVFLKNKLVIDFFASLMFFTRISISWSYFSDKPPNLTRASWSFPLIGLFIGVLSGIVGDFLIYLGLPIFLSCIISITLSVLLTGAFHEDGLADTADGLGAGGSAKKINRIIHDSRLGTYGVVALVLGLLAKIGLTITLVEQGYLLISTLSVGFASGKLAILFSRNYFTNSKFAKTGSIVEVISNKNLFLATIIWLVPSLIIFPFNGILLGTVFMIFIGYIVGNKAKASLGGLTGDILGAIAFLTELAFILGNIMVIVVIN